MHIAWRGPTVVMMLALVVGSCKKDEGPAGPVEGAPPAELVGTWSMQSATVDGRPASLADVLQWADNTASSEFTVEPSGLYTYRELDGRGFPSFLAAGTITVTGNAFTISVSSVNGAPIAAQKQSGTWEINGGELRLSRTQDIGGSTSTVVVVCVKK